MKEAALLRSIGRRTCTRTAQNEIRNISILLNRSQSKSYTSCATLCCPPVKPRNCTRLLPHGNGFRQVSHLRHASTAVSNAEEPQRTSLYDLHLQHGAKMVPFGGYSMPVQYADLSVGDSHKWTREKASLFDVGHMVQHQISGPSAISFLETITPTDISSLAPNASTLSCPLHPSTGGIVDDTVITRLPSPDDNPTFYIVTNAGCRTKDLQYFSQQLSAHPGSSQINHTILHDQGLIALQGPLAASILAPLLPSSAPSLQTLLFTHSMHTPLLLSSDHSSPVLISRGGYTGEDGFELSIPPSHTVAVTSALLASAGPEKLRLAGLGARDSLRLEAGMCLYGHDLDDSTTPVEAGLSWVVSKSRRQKGGFHGGERILTQLKSKKDGGGVERRRVGLVVEGAPAREGAEILSARGEAVGRVTSGCPSPTLGKNIAMGYVRTGSHTVGTEVGVVVRGKRRRAEVVRMPFVEARYWRG